MNKTPDLINKLLNDTLNEYNETGENYVNALISVLRKKHYWPALQVKKFIGYPSMALLHNTYKRTDTAPFQKLYDECRSVIFDFDVENDDCKVITYANSAPQQISHIEYEKIAKQTDKFHVAYDCTTIYVYNHNNRWFFGTTSCPTIDISKFSHPTKRHGAMFNEVLKDMFKDNDSIAIKMMNKISFRENNSTNVTNSTNSNIRDIFTDYLDRDLVYEFGLVHHENTKFIDYTQQFGDNYKRLVHFNTRKKHTNEFVHQEFDNLREIGVIYPQTFETPEDALSTLRKSATSSMSDLYGIIATTEDGKKYKVALDVMIFKEETDPANPNPWRNMIWVYQQNRNDYHINDYIKNYANGIEYPIDNSGNTMDPTYLIHTAISTIKDILYNLYTTTTQYFPKYNRFKMDKNIDKKLPPILQYHLAQLRHKQVTDYKDTKSMITANDIFYYLLHCNSTKNIVALINLFSVNSGFDINQRASIVFSILNNLLH